jgi:predicted lipoprotein with Yx(FWY)xxD motif
MIRNRIVLPILIVVVGAIIAVVATTSSGAKTTFKSSAPAASSISLHQTRVGKALVDAQGRTLYLFAGDRPSTSRLSAAGRSVWPPFTSNSVPAAVGGATAGAIGRIAATKQVTYNGHPLYYYVGDHAPGQIAGQGLNEFGARWYVLSSPGAAITIAAASSTSQAATSSSTSGGGGYGY